MSEKIHEPSEEEIHRRQAGILRLTLRMWKDDPVQVAKALPVFVAAGVPVPVELLPMVQDAAKLWEKSLGKRVSTKVTRKRQWDAVWGVRFLMLHDKTKDEAANIVAEKINRESETVKDWYKGTKFSDAKIDAENWYLEHQNDPWYHWV